MTRKGVPYRASLRLGAMILLLAAVAGLLASGSGADSPRAVEVEQVPAAPADPDATAFASSRSFSRTPKTATRFNASLPAPMYTFIWPSNGAISQGMTARHPRGLDIAAGQGDPVVAVRGGKVTVAGGDVCCVYGLHVVVEHDNGWSSLYAHLGSISVEPGDRVEQGDVLGPSGNTGRADGVHLHFELLWFGAPVNPLAQLQPLRSYTPAIEPLDTPEILDDPEPTVDQSEPVPAPAADAIDAARRWMAQQGEAGYQVDRDSCFAIASGLNYSVSCAAIAWGCEGVDCRSFLEACVIGSLLLVEEDCSGY